MAVEEETVAPVAMTVPPPVGRPDSEHDMFGRLMAGVAADADAAWGFLIVRTAYAADDDDDDDDAQRWSRALARLRRLAAAAGGGDGASGEAALATPVMDCPVTLRNARYSDVRRAWAEWRAWYLQAFAAAASRAKTPGDDEEEDDGGGDGWPAAVRPDCCLVVDDEALESLLGGDEDEACWAVVVDARDPRTVGYGGGGGPFPGWLRCAARALAALDGDLSAGLSLAEELCLPRAYLGQVLLYDGGWAPVRRVDPAPGGGPPAADRYRFPGGPGGTVRGAIPAAALLARILRDVGESVYE